MDESDFNLYSPPKPNYLKSSSQTANLHAFSIVEDNPFAVLDKIASLSNKNPRLNRSKTAQRGQLPISDRSASPIPIQEKKPGLLPSPDAMHKKQQLMNQKEGFLCRLISSLSSELQALNSEISKMKTLGLDTRQGTKTLLFEYNQNKKEIKNYDKCIRFLQEERQQRSEEYSLLYRKISSQQNNNSESMRGAPDPNDPEMMRNKELRTKLKKRRRAEEIGMLGEVEKIRMKCENQVQEEIRRLELRFTNDDEFLEESLKGYIKVLQDKNKELNAGTNKVFTFNNFGI